jgi:hypothetical protein
MVFVLVGAVIVDVPVSTVVVLICVLSNVSFRIDKRFSGNGCTHLRTVLVVRTVSTKVPKPSEAQKALALVRRLATPVHCPTTFEQPACRSSRLARGLPKAAVPEKRRSVVRRMVSRRGWLGEGVSIGKRNPKDLYLASFFAVLLKFASYGRTWAMLANHSSYRRVRDEVRGIVQAIHA